MPSTYSTSLRLELMADGEKSGTWGTITNTNLGTLIEQGVAGVASVAHDDSASYTLTTNNGSSDEARNAVVLMTGALTADREVIVPDVDKVYIFKNGTSGGFALTFKTSGGSGVTIPNGRAAICYVDSGTGTVNAIDDGYFTDSIYIEGSSAGDFITAESTNAGSGSGPDIKLYRNSASPADGDTLSKIVFSANTDDGAGGVSVEDVEYASINVSAPETNETSGEAGKMVIALKRGGTTQNYIEIEGGTSSDSDNDSIVFKTGGTAAITIDNSQDVTFSGAISGTTATFTTASNDPQLILKSTDADANDGPILDLIRDSASPDANDFIGSIRFRADDSAGNETQYADIRVITNDVTDGTEDGQFNLRTMVNGSLRLRIKADPAEIVFNEESQDLDFRVESDNDTHALFVDAGNSRVGINTSSPLGLGLTIDGGTSSGAYFYGGTNNRRQLIFTSFDTASLDAGHTIQASSTSGRIRLVASSTEHMRIDAVSNTTVFNEDSTDQDFRVESDGNTHALFVDASTSRVGIGTSSLGAELCVYASDVSSYMKFTNVNNTSSGVDIGLYDNGSSSPQAVIINREVGGEIALQDNTGTLLTLNDTEAKFNDESRNIDFRVESDTNSHALFVDAGNGRIGINQDVPGYTVDVVQGSNANTNGIVVRPENETQTMIYSFLGLRNTYYTSFTVDSGDTGSNDYFQFFAGTEDVNGELLILSDGGTIFNNGGHDRDFAVESDTNSNMLFVDASANKVIVGGNVYYGGTPAIFNVNGHMDVGTTSGNAWSLAFAASQTVGSMGTVTSKISGFSTMSAIQFYANNVTGGSQAASINFYTTNSATQRNTGRFINEGAFQVSNDGTYRTWSDNITGNQFVNNQQNMVTLTADATSTAFTKGVIRSLCNRTQNSGYTFLTCTSGNLGDDEFRLRGDGQAYADGSWNGGGADYAEYFETTTGSAIPRGTTVVLEGNKVRAATSDDPASAIIGVIRPKEDGKISAMVGNTAWARWSEKYLTDDFGVYLMEDHNVIEWEEEYLDDEGETRKKSHSYESHNIPDGITVPSDATIRTHDDDGVKFQHRQLNPDYDPNLEYVSREDRDEWVIVGLLGQVRILSGQPVGERWTKMKDISATVEEWFIR